MATNNQLKFYKGSSFTATPKAGMIWFNTTDRSIYVYNGTEWERYAGLVDANWNASTHTLTLTSAKGEIITVNDLASAASVAAQLDTLDKKITNSIAALDAEVTSADGNLVTVKVTEVDGKITAVNVTDANVAAKDTMESEIARVEGLVSAEASRADAAEKANAAAAKDADDKAAAAQAYAEGVNTALGQEVTRATEKENELANKISALESAVGGDGSVSDMVDNKIETALDALDFSETKGSTVTVQVVQENGKIITLAVDDSKAATAQALADEIADRSADEAAINARINALDAAETGRVSVLEAQVAALNAATHFEGVVEFDPSAEGATTDGYDAGDIVIYNTKEFIFDGSKWIELGDTTAEQNRISALETLVGTTSVESQINAKINALSDEAKASEDTNLVKVTVNQSNGNVTGVSVDDAALDAKFKTTDDAVALNTAAVADYKTRIETLEGTANALGTTYVKVSDYTTDKAALEKKDSDLQSEIDAAEGRLATAEADIDDAQKDIANLQAGTGLADGSKAPVYTNANYISGATTMVAADMALDAKIKEVADSVTNKNVTAEGDTYVSATAANNKVTVAAVTGTVESKSGLATNQGVYDALCWVEFA